MNVLLIFFCSWDLIYTKQCKSCYKNKFVTTEAFFTDKFNYIIMYYRNSQRKYYFTPKNNESKVL